MRSCGKIIKVLLLSLLLVVFMQPALYKASNIEVIKTFHSDIVINKDATMQVTETIKIVSAGENITHGIYRDFPTMYTDNNGSNFNVGFNVTSVKRDGNDEEYEVSQMDNGKRITIGNKDTTTPSPTVVLRLLLRGLSLLPTAIPRLLPSPSSGPLRCVSLPRQQGRFSQTAS